MAEGIIKSGFKDEEFVNICHELDSPQVDGWEFFVETHGVTIYRQFNEESGLYQYKIYGFLDVLPEICTDVYMDLDYRQEWDTYVKELKEVEADQMKLIYWQVNFPFPLWNRDYVYRRELRQVQHKGQAVWVVLARSQATPGIPERSGVVRVADYIQCSALTTDGKGGTKAYMHYYDNPGGNIPKWLINWAAKTGVPQFLESMQTACRGYPDYCAKKKSRR